MADDVKVKTSPKGEQTKQHILGIAARLFADQGIANVGMREIASQAGVSLNSVTYHFASKENLYRQVAVHVIQDSVDFENIFVQNSKIDFSDRQQVADSLCRINIALFREFSKPDKLLRSDFIMQTVFGKDEKLAATSLEEFSIIDHFFEGFFDLAGISLGRRTKMFLIIVLWSQMLYYVSAMDYVKMDLGVEELPENHFEDIATRVTRTFCTELGLPMPNGVIIDDV